MRVHKGISARTKWVVGGLLGILLTLAVAAAGYAAYFSDRGLPGVSLLGASLTGQSPDAVRDQLNQQVADTQVTIKIGDETRTVSLAELGVRVDVDGTIEDAFAANGHLNSAFTALVAQRPVQLRTTLDQEQLNAYASELESSLGQPARSASVALAADGKSVIVSPGAVGRSVDTSLIADAAERAAATLTSQQVALTLADQAPAVTTEQAQAVADAANGLIALDVSLKTTGKPVVASAAQKAGWIVIDQSATAIGQPTIDAAKAADWVATVGEDSSVAPVAGIQNVNAAGEVLATAKKGVAGKSVNNIEAVGQALVASLQQGQAFAGTFTYTTVEPTYQKKLVAEGAQNLAYQATPDEKWLDVNLSNATVTAYVGSSAVKGPMPMVPGKPSTPTVTGQYQIYLKYASQTMRGSNGDGTTYETPGVPWVSYFYRGYAFHGAPWRSSFGWNGPGGSHGCVNMPVSTAKWVYDWAPIGTTVVVHK